MNEISIYTFFEFKKTELAGNHNEFACVFTARLYASKNADWNQQQLTDGGVLANRNRANHPNCFQSNQKKVQILAFLDVIMPSSRKQITEIKGDSMIAG